MIRRHANKAFITMIVAVAVLVSVTIFTGPSRAQLQVFQEEAPPADTRTSQVAVEVGTYTPAMAFEKHPAQQEVMEAFQIAQAQMQEAQQQGDQETIQQVQQQYEQKRAQIVEEFQRDVAKVLPEAAEAAGVKVVALQVVYTADDARVKDVTPHLINALNTEMEEKSPLPSTAPQFPQR